MTRRDFITKGIAYVGASALASPVRSVVGGRHSQYVPVSQASYTAADYVTDGLVAIYDGIENAGLGTHDYEAANWTNLVAGSPFGDGVSGVDTGFVFTGTRYYPTTHIWTDDACRNIGGETGAWTCFGVTDSDGTAQNVICTEAVGNVYAVTGSILDNKLNCPIIMSCGVNFYRYGTWGMSSSMTLWPSGKWQPWNCGANATLNAMSPLVKRSYHVIIEGSNKVTCMVNGEDGAYSNGRSSGVTLNIPPYYPLMAGNNMIMEINCIRMYTRFLTAEERKWNVLVDSARFGI